MDRRKKKPDPDELRAFKRDFFARIENRELSLVEAIKGMRKVSFMTQKEFAEFSKVSIKIIKEVEKGSGNPTLKTLNQIGDFFGLEIAFQRRQKSMP